MKRVRAVLGTNRFAKSFIYKCKQGCRTFADQYRNLHSKFYTFTQAGKSKNVMVVGSDNLTRNAIYHQWNDGYFMSGNKALFDQFVSAFKDMKHRPRAPGSRARRRARSAASGRGRAHRRTAVEHRAAAVDDHHDVQEVPTMSCHHCSRCLSSAVRPVDGPRQVR